MSGFVRFSAPIEHEDFFRDVPHGDYEVEVCRMELIASVNNEPMVTIWFKVVSGEYTGSMIFMNQVITTGFKLHFCNELLRSLVANIPEMEIKFECFRQYGELIMDIEEAISGTFTLEYDEDRRGLSTYVIKNTMQAA